MFERLADKCGDEVMSISIRFEWDPHGYPRAVVAIPHEMVGEWLESDIQGSEASATEMIAVFDQVRSGQIPTWEGTGNAFHVETDGHSARMSCLWDESQPQCSIPLDDLREAVARWAEFIRSGRSKPEQVVPGMSA